MDLKEVIQEAKRAYSTMLHVHPTMKGAKLSLRYETTLDAIKTFLGDKASLICSPEYSIPHYRYYYEDEFLEIIFSTKNYRILVEEDAA